MPLEIWRRLPFSLESAGSQLARSEVLLGQMVGPSLYWYTAASSAFILGAAQKPDVLDLAVCKGSGYSVYKRTSGGTVVAAGPNFPSLDIALPFNSILASSDITHAYKWLADCWVTTLARLGIAAKVVEPDAARFARTQLETLPSNEKLVKLVCFGTLSPYEVVSEDGRKLIGLSQVKRRTGSLLQAGLHLNWQPKIFTRHLNLTEEQKEILTTQLATCAVGLNDLVTYPVTLEDVIAAFEETLLQDYKVGLQIGELTDAELDAVKQAKLEKFFELL